MGGTLLRNSCSVIRFGTLLSLLVLLGMPTDVRAQCANDNTIVGGAVTPPCPGSTTVPCVQGGRYALVNVVAGNQYTFSTCTATFDTYITLYNNAGGAALGFNDDGCGLQSTITWTATFTGQLRVLVDQWPCANNTICAPLVIACSAPPPPLTNDNPCGAINLTVNPNCVFQTYTNAGATATAGVPAPGCSSYLGGDVWFSFTAPATGMVEIETGPGVVTDGGMAVYSAPSCSGPFALLACDDDSGVGLMPYLSMTGLTPGQTYYIRFWEYGNNNNGTFQICLHGITTLPAGDCIYQLNMFDSFGDGWDGSTVGISINGSPYTNYTITGSTGTALIGLNIGDILVVNYTAAGIFQNEITYSLTFYPGTSAILSQGPNPPTGIVLNQTVDCQPPPAQPEDCSGAVTICNGQTFNNNTNNTGNVVDLNSSNWGCLASGERQGTWYFFSSTTPGNVAFDIVPADPLDDYDFAIWGPMPNPVCPPPGQPTRCSYSALSGPTGLNYTAVDNTEGAFGDKWVNDLTVAGGEVYILYISNWSQSGLAFDLNWNLSNGASLDCTVLPLELLDFSGTPTDDGVLLEWSTATEMNTDHFRIERSTDGNVFAPIGAVQAAGNSLSVIDYAFEDLDPGEGLRYYRLQEVDQNGATYWSPTISVLLHGQYPLLGTPSPNPASDLVRLELLLRERATVEVSILDAMGRTVIVRRISGEAGRMTTTFDTSTWPMGTYLVRAVDVGSGTLSLARFVKH